MSCNINEKILVPPLRTRTLYNFEAGTKLRVVTYDGQVFEGYTKTARKKTELELVNATKLGRNGKKTTEQGFIRFEAEELEKVEVLGDATEWNRKMGGIANLIKTERLYSTVTITSVEDLLKFLNMLKGFSEVALNLYGRFVGRDGQVGWIILFLGDTLVCIDVLTLAPALKAFWDILRLHLFENESIEKVVYNSKPIADFLYHRQGISIKNVFDLQVAQFFYWCRGKPRDALAKCKTDLHYKKLSRTLKTFLPDEIITEELFLLEEFEGRDFSMTSPLLERPMEDMMACKCVAIEMKYLLRLKKVFQKLMLDKFYDCVSSQMTDIVGGNNAVSEMAMKFPYKIPDQVYKKVVMPGYSDSSIKGLDLDIADADDLPCTNVKSFETGSTSSTLSSSSTEN